MLSYKNKIFFKIKEVNDEIKNISWPNKKDVTQTIIIVIIFIIFTILVLWMVDSILIYILSKLV